MFSFSMRVFTVVLMAVLMVCTLNGQPQQHQMQQQEGQHHQHQLTPEQQQQLQQQMQQQMQQQQEPVEVSGEELDKIADAYIDVVKIREEALQTLEQTTDPAEAQQIQMQAEQQMHQAVESHGVEVHVYNRVVEATQHDENLRDRLMRRLQTRM